jgi:hypothetical protein
MRFEIESGLGICSSWILKLNPAWCFQFFFFKF